MKYDANAVPRTTTSSKISALPIYGRALETIICKLYRHEFQRFQKIMTQAEYFVPALLLIGQFARIRKSQRIPTLICTLEQQ